jgi:run domain Beclin-1 interacting cysteine-rich containing protein
MLTNTPLMQFCAHFSISEALIAAIEQMKWNHIIAPQQAQENEEEDSDEEIQQLKALLYN